MIAVAGLVAWAGVLLLLPASMAARIFLVGPLVIVPVLLGRLPARQPVTRLAGWPVLAAALPLIPAVGLEPGPIAAVLTVPWLIVCLVGFAAAVVHGLPRLPGILRPESAADLGADAALGFLAVGAVFLGFDRLGLRPLDFAASIILLTAIHFHVAGFGLIGVASRLARRGSVARLAILGLVVGMPITATGFTVDSTGIAAVGGAVVGLSGIAVGAALLRARAPGLRRWMPLAAGCLLLAGMPLGISWAIATWLAVPFLDLDTMIRTHGVLNAAGVLLAAIGPEPG